MDFHVALEVSFRIPVIQSMKNKGLARPMIVDVSHNNNVGLLSTEVIRNQTSESLAMMSYEYMTSSQGLHIAISYTQKCVSDGNGVC